MSARLTGGRARAAAAAALLGIVLAGCGQRGPLTLPDAARPIKRLDRKASPGAPAATRGEEPSAGGEAPPSSSGAAPAPAPNTAGETETDRRQRPENER
jgi:predicted small lipoprotein YifL